MGNFINVLSSIPYEETIAIGALFQQSICHHEDLGLAKEGLKLDRKALSLDEQNIWREDLRDISECYHQSVDNILLISTIILGACYEMVSNGTFPPDDMPELYLNFYCICLWTSVFGPFWSVFFGLLAKRNLLQFTLLMTHNRDIVHFKAWSFPQFWKHYCSRYYRLSELFLWISMVSSLMFVVTLAAECLFEDHPFSMVFTSLLIGGVNFFFMAVALFRMQSGTFDLEQYSEREIFSNITRDEYTPLLPNSNLKRQFF